MTNIFCQRNQEKCSKSRLVTTSAIKHFIAKVAYFYPKSGVVLGASIYVKPLPNRHSRASSPTRSLSKGKGVQKRINISRTSYLAPSIITKEDDYTGGDICIDGSTDCIGNDIVYGSRTDIHLKNQASTEWSGLELR